MKLEYEILINSEHVKRGIAKEEEMKLGKKIVVTIGVLLSALLCVNMILYTPTSAMVISTRMI